MTKERSVCPVRIDALLQSREQVDARLSDAAVGRGHSGKCRPAALLDVGVLHPRTDLFQFGHVRRCIGALSELVGAYGGKSATAAALEFLSANCFAVLPNVHPPQPKPMTTVQFRSEGNGHPDGFRSNSKIEGPAVLS